MKTGPYEVLHMDTTKAESYVVFWHRDGKFERALHLGKRGGFTSMAAAVEAATNQVKYGTVNV